MHTPHIRIADWTVNPGLQHRWQGRFSAQEYIETSLQSQILHARDNKLKVIIDLDGTRGYAISFIESVFGTITDLAGIEWALANVQVKSDERPWLADEAIQAMLKRRHN